MTKRGAKRPALSDSVPDPSVSTLPSKRVMDAPSFDVRRVESSHQHLMAGPPLDIQRAESSRQHVRALNAQFASWVQQQLQNHPDELWEDGVRDYLTHASHILEKFKDVVDWLRANAAKSTTISPDHSPSDQKNIPSISGSNTPALRSKLNNGYAKQRTQTGFSGFQNLGSQSTDQTPSFTGSVSDQKNLLAGPQNNKPMLHFGIYSGSANPAKPVSFSDLQNTGSQSSGLFSFNQPTSFAGGQNSTNNTNVEASGDLDEENDLEQPSSPSLKKTEEKGIVVVYEAKCKVYVKPDNPADKGWKDMGLGHLSIKCKEGASKATKESKPTIVIRNDVGKIVLNALIYPGIKINIQKNTVTAIFHTTGGGQSNGTESANSDVVARTYLLRSKNEEETTKLAAAIKGYAPLA